MQTKGKRGKKVCVGGGEGALYDGWKRFKLKEQKLMQTKVIFSSKQSDGNHFWKQNLESVFLFKSERYYNVGRI